MSMETDSPVVYHGTSESRFPKEEVQRVVVQELTGEEKELIRQCNKESLYYRCLPFSFAGMVAVHLAARRGFITTHPIWGTAFSMTGAAFLGWLVGKFSYRKKCEDKFLHLENSTIGDAVRRKRGYTSERFQNEFPKSQTSEVLKDDSFNYYSDSDYHPSTGSLNLDVDKNIQYSGLDDRERPSTDRDPMQYSEESEPIRRFTTYEDLRQRNREEYERSQRRYSPPSRLDLAPPADQRPYSNVDTTPPRRYNSEIGEGERRTTYGNNWDNAKLL